MANGPLLRGVVCVDSLRCVAVHRGSIVVWNRPARLHLGYQHVADGVTGRPVFGSGLRVTVFGEPVTPVSKARNVSESPVDHTQSVVVLTENLPGR